ncbi:MAG: tetratricopeptide repeat protein [Gammaproteobacteria bacterium]
MKGKYGSTLIVLLAALLMSQTSVARTMVSGCGALENAYGPFDYTNYEHFTNKLPVVEQHHFSHEVEALLSGMSDNIYGDLQYTLLAFPNHHRALVSISKFEFEVEGAREMLLEEKYDVDCYFRRGIAFKPTDGTVRLIYATYLHKKGFYDQAEKQYNEALILIPDSAEVHYNLGLLYADRNKLGLAVKHGHKAYELGYPLNGLKNKLIKKGVWDKTVSQN